jgi:hypothetical protein
MSCAVQQEPEPVASPPRLTVREAVVLLRVASNPTKYNLFNTNTTQNKDK